MLITISEYLNYSCIFTKTYLSGNLGSLETVACPQTVQKLEALR